MTDKKELDEFARKSIPILKSNGYLNEGYHPSVLVILIISILWLSSLGLFYYAGSSDWFKSTISHIVNLEPQINVTTKNEVPINIENDYDLNPENNFTIINNIIVPEGACP